MKPIITEWRQRFLCCLALLLSIGSYAADKPAPGDNPKKEIAKEKPVKPVTNDPIRIIVSANKQAVSIGEEVELTITAHLLNIPSSVMFFAEGSNKFSLKVVTPKGFIVTGGTYTDYIGDELQPGRKPEVSYTIKGHFESVTDGTAFRVLRAGKNANAQSLFVEKAALHIGTPKTEQSKNQVAIQDKPTTIGLIVRDMPHPFNAVAAFNQCLESESVATATATGTPTTTPGASNGSTRNSYANASEYIQYTVTNVPSAGNYTLKLRYTSGENPVAGVRLNGSTTVIPFTLGSSGGWYTFAERTLTVALIAGNNTIRIQGGSGGGFTQDQICVDGGSTTTPTTCDFNITATTSTQNPACNGAFTLNAPCTGANCSGVTYAWSGQGLSSTSQSPTVTAPGSNNTYTYSVTASKSGCTSKTASVNVTVSNCTTTLCDFNITATASTQNPACNGAFTLNAPCTGANCSGVTYAWSGQGLSSTSQSPSLTAPGSNGTFTYSVTASKTGCTSKPASVNVTVSNCPTTTTNYRDMGRAGTDKTYINISVSISNGTAYLTDAVGYTGAGGYNLLYFINDIYVGTSLNSYPVPTNGKYVVDKLYTRDTPIAGYARVMDLWRAGNDDTFIRKEQGRHQQVVATYDAATASTAEVPTSDNKGMLLPINQPWFIKSNNWNAQALKDGPAKILPAGKIWGGISQDGLASQGDYAAKGWNAYRLPYYKKQSTWYPWVDWNTQGLLLANGKDFVDALTAAGQGFTNYDTPYQQGVIAANNNGNRTYKYQFDEFNEGAFIVKFESDGYLGYWQELKRLNPNAKIFGVYGQLNVRYLAKINFKTTGGGSRNPLQNLTYKRLYSSQAEARNSRATDNGQTYIDDFYQTRYGGNTFSSIGMEQLIQVYPETVNDVDLPYVKMHEMDVMLKQDPNRRPIGWLWPWRESKKGPDEKYYVSEGVTWDHETTNPAGRVLKGHNQIHGLIISEVFAFDMMVRGQGLVFWNHNYLQNDDRNRIVADPSNIWLPNPGSPSTITYVPAEPLNDTSNDPYFSKPFAPLVGFDAAHQGRDKAIRALEYLGTPTPSWEYATYSLNGVTRTAPSDGSAILQHANDYKPMAMILSNPANGKKVVWAFDPYCAPNLSQTMVVNLPSSQSITINLKGNGLYVVLVN